ncbi:MAG: YwaF family protein, partial [Oscillospiraceae bacterium]|nr:YwaF family protein [Oscillospiraceae bacterium]
MRDFDTTHIILLAVTAAFALLSCYAVSRMSRRWQNVTFVFGAFMVAAGIFFRYGWGLTFGGEISWQTLGLQMLQVCNFNLILVLLMLVPKFELARQYSVFFSMFAAFTTLVSIPNVWQNHLWHSPEILNSWLNHVFAICLPLWMVAARRLKPRREYVLPVTGCVVGYFSVVAALSALLIKS